MPTPTRQSPRAHRARVPAVAGLLTAALLIAGCGSAHHAQVASLASPGGGSGGATKSSVTANQGIPDPHGAPRASLDQTMAQRTALNKPFEHCVGPYHYGRDYKAFLAHATRCIRLIPLPPWQYDPANPQARAFIGNTVSCLQAKGYHVQAFLYKPSHPFGPIWDVVYAPSHGLFGYTHKTAVALAACQQQALK